MMPVMIEHEEWISREAEEALLRLTDGEHSLTCFSHPHRHLGVELSRSSLLVMGAKSIVRMTASEVSIRQVGEGFTHEIVGVVADRAAPQVKVGDLLLELDVPLPGDVEEGDVVGFIAERIDLIGG